MTERLSRPKIWTIIQRPDNTQFIADKIKKNCSKLCFCLVFPNFIVYFLKWSTRYDLFSLYYNYYVSFRLDLLKKRGFRKTANKVNYSYRHCHLTL